LIYFKIYVFTRMFYFLIKIYHFVNTLNKNRYLLVLEKVKRFRFECLPFFAETYLAFMNYELLLLPFSRLLPNNYIKIFSSPTTECSSTWPFEYATCGYNYSDCLLDLEPEIIHTPFIYSYVFLFFELEFIDDEGVLNIYM